MTTQAVTVREEIRPLHRLPEQNTVCVLLVGVEGLGQEELTKSITEFVSRGNRRKVKFRTATTLPLPPDTDSSRPRIDFVIFIINQASKLSYTVIRNSLAHVDTGFFLGRALFLVSSVDPANAAIETETVSTLAEAYSSCLLFADLKNDHERRVVAEKCANLITTAGGFKPISPVYLS